MPFWPKKEGTSTVSKGLVGHTAVLNALVNLGLEVLTPWGDHHRYDLAFVDPESPPEALRLLRVQCKVAHLSEDGGCIVFNAYNVVPGERGRRSVKKGYVGNAEYFGVYSPHTGKVYMVRVCEVPAIEVRLRLTKSKNNQEKGVRWARDYEI
jgi:hypothetical protein